MSYLRPTTLNGALEALRSDSHVVLAGGTDYYPARVGRPLQDNVLDITALSPLRGITENADHYRIGALTTWTDILRAPLPRYFDGLKLAAKEVGGVQIQNAGTLCGNVCNASPAADGVPNLLALDAKVELSALDGVREVALDRFITGNRQTACASSELVTALIVPKLDERACSTFTKLGSRAYLVISIAMVAVVLVPSPAGTVGDLRISVGACSSVAVRLAAAESALNGQRVETSLAERVQSVHLDGIVPIDDVRASARYRQDAALLLVRRALRALCAVQR